MLKKLTGSKLQGARPLRNRVEISYQYYYYSNIPKKRIEI